MNDINSAFLELGLINDKRYIYSFNYGRSALKFLIKSENWEGKTILLPGFICPGVVDAVIKAGANPFLIDINPDTFHIDIKNNANQIKWENVSAVLLNHTLGNPINIEQESKEINKIARKNIPIIEDCAHSLFSKYKGKILNIKAEYALISLYKQLPNSYGSLLLSKNELNNEMYNKLSYYSANPMDMLNSFIKRNGVIKSFFDVVRKFTKPELNYKNNDVEITAINSKLIDFSIENLNKLKSESNQEFSDSFDIIENLLLKQKNIDGYKSSSLYINYCLNNYNTKLRDYLYYELRKKGLFVDRIWADSPVLNENYRKYYLKDCENAKKIAKSVINIPVKYVINRELSKKMYININKIIKKYGN